MARPPVSINEVAARVKLSKGTVSRILNDSSAPFSAETRKRVLSAVSEMGYRPNSIARALATGRTGSVALWIPDLRNSYHALVAQSFETVIESHSHRMVINLLGWGNVLDRDNRFFHGMMGSVDGIIAHGVNLAGRLASEHSPFRGVPIVTSDIAEDPNIRDYVQVDLTLATRMAIEHLIKPGRKRVAYLFHDLERRLDDSRYQSYRTVMEEAGLKPELIDVPGETRAKVRQSLRDYVILNGPPEAIFCHNDDFAIAAYRALCDIGVKVPSDVALIGCDGIEDTEYLATLISTIAHPYHDMCQLTWKFLRHRMQEPDAPPQRAILQPKLILRESSEA